MSIDRRTALGLIGGTAALPRLAHAERARIADLIARMTIEEKAGQLSCFSDEIRPVGSEFNPKVNRTGAAEQLRAIEAGRVVMLFNGYGIKGARVAQAAALRSRLRIPLIFAADVIHGCRTIFPIPLAEAAAFDPELSARIARGVAAEMRAAELHWTFAPMVDVASDQRWSRVAEGAGEHVCLGCQLAAARVRGFASGRILATPKHSAGYAAVRGGMEYGPVDMSERELEAIRMPPFAAAFAAGAAATMAAGKAHWRDAPDRARDGFGHGLSFTSFELGAIAVDHTAGKAQVAVDVTNTGRRSGTAILQPTSGR